MSKEDAEKLYEIGAALGGTLGFAIQIRALRILYPDVFGDFRLP